MRLFAHGYWYNECHGLRMFHPVLVLPNTMKVFDWGIFDMVLLFQVCPFSWGFLSVQFATYCNNNTHFCRLHFQLLLARSLLEFQFPLHCHCHYSRHYHWMNCIQIDHCHHLNYFPHLIQSFFCLHLWKVLQIT